MNLMLINVSTRRFGRAVRLPEGDIAATPGAGVSKSAVSRRFVALSAERMKVWMSADLSQLDLLAIQIDGMHVSNELTLLAAVGIDGAGGKHPLGLLEGATENTAVVQALLDNLIERGLDPKHCRLFILDGSKALIRRSAARLVGIHQSSVARFTRRATLSNGCPSICTPRCVRHCVRPGNWTMRRRPSGCCAIWRRAGAGGAGCCCQHPRRAR